MAEKFATLLDKWTILQAILADPELSPTAKNIAGVLLDCLDGTTGRCNPSIAYLGDRVGRGRRQVGTVLAELVTAGWLSRIPRRGTNHYVFAFARLARTAEASHV